MFKNKSILITGGTGSLGKKLTLYLLKNFKNLKKIIIFSRDELKQFEMKNEIDQKLHEKLRFFLGDIRDQARLLRAFDGVDYVIHTAALKQVPVAEYNPDEFIKTNIIGSNNVIEAALQKNVKKVVALSTDKAAAPINLYGATKLCSDKLFVSANNIKGNKKIIFSVVRYGNVMGSRGSVVPYFFKTAKQKGEINITDKNMTRFNITINHAINFVIDCLKTSIGGEIFVPKLPSYNILTLAKAISENAKIKYIGIRSGEKIHEEMITYNDSFYSIVFKKNYVLFSSKEQLLKFKKKYKNSKVIKKPFNYSSENNNNFLSKDKIKELIKINIRDFEDF